MITAPSNNSVFKIPCSNSGAVFACFNYWSIKIALYCKLNFMFCFYNWKEHLSHWPVEAGLWIMSERLYPPELSERFRGFFFALVFALLKRASLLKAKTVQNGLKHQENWVSELSVSSFSASSCSYILNSNNYSHQLSIACLFLLWHFSAYLKCLFNYGGGGGWTENQEKEEKILSQVDFVSNLFHGTNTCA